MVARVGDLNKLNILVANLEVAATGHAIRQEGRISAAQHLTAGINAFDAQTDSQLNVRPHLVADAGGALRSQDEMHAQRTPKARNAVKLFAKLGIVGDHLGILVNDDHQERQRLAIRALVETLAAVLDNIACLAQQRLTALKLGSNGGEDAAHGGLVQVGDAVNAVRQLVEGRERAAALIVHQHKVERAGVVGQRQPDHQAHQQLGFTGTRTARHHRVNAVGLGFEAQHTGSATGGHA